MYYKAKDLFFYGGKQYKGGDVVSENDVYFEDIKESLEQCEGTAPDTQAAVEINTDLEAENKALRAENEELRAVNADLTAENAELRAENEALRATVASLRAENEELRAENEELEAERALPTPAAYVETPALAMTPLEKARAAKAAKAEAM
jgi:predicted nuclease with TOPRIM domain